MRFSVVVPFLNEERHIESCLLALRAQTAPRSEFELILVDNRSDDSSPDVVRRHADVLLVEQTDVPRNVYASRNRGAELASGEILAFTDADCVPGPDWLAEIEAGMLGTGAALVLGRRTFPPDVSRALRLFEYYESAKAEFVAESRDRRYLFGYGNNMAVRRRVFEDLGAFAELPLSGDTEFVQRYAEKLPGELVAYLDGMSVEHLEVTTVMSWLRKLRSYGTHNRQVEELRRGYQNLPFRLKIEIVRRCKRANGLGLMSTAGLVSLLAVGNLFYILGGRTVRAPSEGSGA